MAYDKKYIENGDLVKEYLDDREDRIEGAFEGVDNKIDSGFGEIDYFYHKPDDVWDINMGTGQLYIESGFISGSNRSLRFGVRANKSLRKINNIEILDLKLNIRSVDGDYLGSPGYISGGYDYFNDNSYTVNAYKVDDYRIGIELIRDTAHATTNNTPLSIVVGRMRFRFK